MRQHRNAKHVSSLEPGSFYVLAAIFLWSSLGVVIRLADVPVHLLLFFSLLIALPLQGVMVLLRYRDRVPRDIGSFRILVLGPVTLLNTFTLFYALQNTTISNALMTHYTAPVFVAFLAPIFLGELLTRRVLVALALSSAGLWILLDINPSELLRTWASPSTDTLGIMSGMVSGFAYAILILLTRVFAQGYHPVVLTFFQSVMMAVMLVPFVSEFPTHGIWAFMLVGVVHSTIAPVLYFKGLALVRANRASILGYLEPVCAIILGIVFLGEYPSAVSIVGGAMITISGYMVLKDETG